MSDNIRNINDQHFKSTVVKLKSSGWIFDAKYTPKTEDGIEHVEIIWTDKGMLLASAYKSRLTNHPLWPQAMALVETLNEQEEAFFYENFLSAIPDNPPK